MQFSDSTAQSQIFAGIAAICVAAAGCAGGGILDRTIVDAELPVDQPASPYPTALRAAGASTDRNAAPPASAINTVASQPTATNPRAHQESPQSLRAPLAVIPPQLVRQPASPPRPEPSLAVPTTDQRQTLVDLTPATNWAPPTIARASLSDETEPELFVPPSAKPKLIGKEAPEVQVANFTSVASTPEKPASEEERRLRIEQARSALVEALEADIKQRRAAGTNDADLVRLEQQLRLAYVAGGRLDEAVSAVESLDNAQKDAFKELMFGLGVWLSPDESQRIPLRSAKVLHSLRDATAELASAGKLEVRNLVFCERVDHFGWYTEFPRREFQAKQQVILYAEVENFTAEHKGAAGYETELQGSYVILDASGQEVASRQLQLDKEVCRNQRRDYFLAYRIYMPEGISPGRYRLELTVEDLKARGKYQGRKLGEGVIEFTIR